MNAMVLQRTYSAQEVADRLGISVSMVYKMVRTGELPCLRIGDRMIFNVAVLASKWPDVFGDEVRAA